MTEQVYVFPLSLAQQRIWFLDQLAQDGPLFNLSTAVRLFILLDAAILKRTLAEVIRRHEALRTTIRVVDGEPQQIVSMNYSLDLPVIDLTHLSSFEREA